jgi:hypothetical protein
LNAGFLPLALFGTLQGRGVSLAKILLAIPGSCDAGWAAHLLNLHGRVFGDRERL